MKHRTSEVTGSISRREVIRTGALVGGVVAVAGTSLIAARTANAQSADPADLAKKPLIACNKLGSVDVLSINSNVRDTITGDTLRGGKMKRIGVFTFQLVRFAQ